MSGLDVPISTFHLPTFINNTQSYCPPSLAQVSSLTTILLPRSSTFRRPVHPRRALGEHE